jgi:fructokinase
VDHLEWGLSASDWCKINTDEFDILTGLFDWKSLSNADSFRQTAGRCGAVILTRSDLGCEVYHTWEVDDGDGGEYFPSESFHEPGVPARVVDTVGAGDAFTAAMVCLHLEGRPLRECARFANHYAARVCEQQGATPRIDRAAVERVAFG